MSNSFEVKVLSDYCSNKRLTRAQLTHQNKLKALYQEEEDDHTNNSQDQEYFATDNPALEIGVEEQEHRPSLRIQFVKENIQNRRNRSRKSGGSKKKSSFGMSPSPLEEEDGDSSNAMSKSAVTVTPKPLEDSPAPNNDDDEDESTTTPPPPPKPLTKAELAEKATRRAAHPMRKITEPGPNDCLFGRGGGTNHHPGNKRYRKMVEDKNTST